MTDFARKLRDWRGKKLQKEAADILNVPLDTYRAWENSFSTPAHHYPPTMEEIEKRMETNKQ